MIEKNSTTAPICWLFCTVIDNYGDIGVSWRLANILQKELGWQIVLWVDDITALTALCPDCPVKLPAIYHGISIQHWQKNLPHEYFSQQYAPNIVVETFACDLPNEVEHIIRDKQAIWINWEYLSAEASNERLHLKPSPQSDGYLKYFWFMGFSEKSGGLLREHHFADFINQTETEFRKKLMLPNKTSEEWLLFGYHSPIWAKWVECWQKMNQPITLLLAGNQIIESLKQSSLLPQSALTCAGDFTKLGSVNLIKIPFVPQDQFDLLLHFSDGLVIRGEDSFVRAQFSNKPFFWHIYPQDEMIHLNKLHAFWQRVYPYYFQEIIYAHQLLSDELNHAQELSESERYKAWQTMFAHSLNWKKGVADWNTFLTAQPSAAEKLANFIEDKLK